MLSCLFLVIPTLQDKFKPQSLYPKIGTHEQNSHLCFIILKKEYRAEGTHPKARSAGSIKLENLRKELLTAALPPQRHSVYSIGSRHLGASTSRGTWGLILDRAPGKVAWDKYRKVIRKYAVIIRASGCADSPQIHYAGLKPTAEDEDSLNKRGQPDTKTALSGDDAYDDGLQRRSNGKSLYTKSRSRKPRAKRALKPRATYSDGVVVAQSPAPPEMVMIAQPKDVPFPGMKETYYTYPNPGKGVLTYVIDSGCDFNSPDLTHIDASSVDWLFSGPLPSDEKSDDDEPSNPRAYGHFPTGNEDRIGYHGTIVATHVVGNTKGTATSASLVVVKLQSGRNTAHHLTEIDTLLKIYDHMYEDYQKRKDSWPGFVVVYSHGTEVLNDETAAAALKELYEELCKAFAKPKLKGYIVVPAGNERPGVPINEVPAIYKATSKPSPANLVVVGGVSTRTGLNKFQTEKYAKLYAPATDLKFVLPSGETRIQAGTSFSTPLVAGLLATLLGRGVKNPVKQMEKWAYPRNSKGPKVIWNGITKDMWPSEDSMENIEFTN